MSQTLLFPDPRPLVERLGPEFFRQAPPRPGVYLMRDAADAVLYVGKAKNLRKRLASYRVANPDRIPRRHLRLLRSVARIELQECPDESAALARESELLLSLRPRFNRAGTWPGRPAFLAWRTTGAAFELAVLPSHEAGWSAHGPMGAGAFHVRGSLARVLWSGLHPHAGLTSMPAGWFQVLPMQTLLLPAPPVPQAELKEAELRLRALFAGDATALREWIRERVSRPIHPFDLAMQKADFDVLHLFALNVEVSRGYEI
jgi:predicted GIY-YIG superfamily endonuclease